MEVNLKLGTQRVVLPHNRECVVLTSQLPLAKVGLLSIMLLFMGIALIDQAHSQSSIGGLKAYAKGKMANFVAKPAPEALPTITFEDASGRTRSLAQWSGKVVLLNIWATWCAPCRLEMPSLDALKKSRGGADFDVIAVSTDRGGIAQANAFLDELKVTALEPLVDPTSKSVVVLKVTGMPTTLLIDREGREIGRLTGPGEWDSEDAKRLIEAAIFAEKEREDLLNKLKARLADCGPSPKIAGGPWFSWTYKQAALDDASRLALSASELQHEMNRLAAAPDPDVLRALKNLTDDIGWEMDTMDKPFLCIKEILYVGPAVNPMGGNAARAVFVGYHRAADFKEVSYTHDFFY